MDYQLPELSPGQIVAGRYRIEAAIGRGGFGAVYRATELKLERLVALKVLLPSLVGGPSALARFRREVELAQRLEHPNTVRLYDFGETEQGLPFISWEFLRGRSLEEVLQREGAMAVSRVVRIASQVLKSLMEAHGRGIVHRDVKPANVFLCDFAGEPDFVKVLDFGVAKIAEGEQGAHLTRQGQAVGTPSYMAPEQVVSDPVDARTDLYALGLTMAEMLTGRRVYDGEVAMKICIAQASRDPVPLPAEVAQTSLGALIACATHKSPANRFFSAADMLHALEQASGATVSAPPQAVVATAPRDIVSLGTADTVASDPNLAVALAPTQTSGVPALSSGSQPVPPAVVGRTGQPLSVARRSSRGKTLLIVGACLLGGALAMGGLFVSGVITPPSLQWRVEADRGAPAASGAAAPIGPAAERQPVHESLRSVTFKGQSVQALLDALAADGWKVSFVSQDTRGKVDVTIYMLAHPDKHYGSVQFQKYQSADDASAAVGILRGQAAVIHDGPWLLYLVVDAKRDLSLAVLERALR